MTPQEAIKFLKQLYPNGGHCWLDYQRMEAITLACDVLSKIALPSNIGEASLAYRKNREECGVLDHVMLGEIEAAYEEGIRWASVHKNDTTKGDKQ